MSTKGVQAPFSHSLTHGRSPLPLGPPHSLAVYPVLHTQEEAEQDQAGLRPQRSLHVVPPPRVQGRARGLQQGGGGQLRGTGGAEGGQKKKERKGKDYALWGVSG